MATRKMVTKPKSGCMARFTRREILSGGALSSLAISTLPCAAIIEINYC